MSYQIRPVEFKDEVPSNDEIKHFIETNSTQNVVISKGEFRGQYKISFKDYCKDKLEFSRNETGIVISGYAEVAPAVCEIFYSSLISLGGLQKLELPLVEFPVSNEAIVKLNQSTRKTIANFGIFIWLYIFSVILVLGGLASCAVWWLVNA